MIPGTTRIDGVGCDDCTTPVTMPFPVSIYGTSFTSGTVGSNGILAFGTAGNAFAGSCLPVAIATNQLMPFYRDQRTDCTGGCGIFTATTGSTPNRVFTVEYKTIYFGEASTTPTLDYEVNFYESGATAFDYTYGLINATTQTARITSIGVQNNATLFRQFACDATGQTPPVTTGQRLSWTPGPCATPTPSPTTSPGQTPSPTPSCTPTAWTVAAPFPGPDAYGLAMTSDGTNAYAAGGYSFSASNTLSSFERYNPATNTWTVLAPMPDTTSVASAVYAPNVNKVYVFGGAQGATLATISNANRVYNVATNTWTAGAVLPAVRSQMASGYFNGKIYLIGGYSTANVTPTESQVWEYDPVTDTYTTTRLAIPHPEGGTGFGIINGHFYVAGGRDGVTTNYNGLWDYDIAANTWTQRANIIGAGINVPGSGVVNGQLWLFGGGTPFDAKTPETTNASQFYNPSTDTWTAGPNLSAIRSFVGGIGAGNTLVAAGGYNGTTTVNLTETLTTCGGEAVHLHRHLQPVRRRRQLAHLPGRPAPACRQLPSARSGSISHSTGSSTPWVGAALTQPAATSLTRSSTTRPPTPGSPRPGLTRITR